MIKGGDGIKVVEIGDAAFKEQEIIEAKRLKAILGKDGKIFDEFCRRIGLPSEESVVFKVVKEDVDLEDFEIGFAGYKHFS